jgi:tRNA (guanine26-N2/guanine27-N2)-dimethyltransferase
MRANSNTRALSGQLDVVKGARAPKGFDMITEGTAHQIFREKGEIFYNKVQVINRDLSILVIKVFDEIRRKEHETKMEEKRKKLEKNNKDFQLDTSIENIKILEALSATGLRSIRYWKEIPNIDHIVANDLMPDAVEAIKRNLEFNNVNEDCIRPNLADATEFMYLHRKPELQYHVVDLDPYGGADIFLDGAVQCVKDGGLLCVTCTDMPVLAGKQPGTCFAKYNSYPLPVKSCHEQALRILLAAIQNHASKYKKYIQPLISFSIDFYVRVFVRVFSSASKVKKIHSSYSNVVMCSGCEAIHFEQIGKIYKDVNDHLNLRTSHPNYTKLGAQCEECGGNHKLGGPIWTSPIHDVSFVEACLLHLQNEKHLFSTAKRMVGLLTLVSKELPDAPLFYELDNICAKLKCQSPSLLLVRSALLNAGYRVSQTHCKPTGIKTDAPINVLFDIFRAFVKQNSNKIPGTDTIAGKILNKEIKTRIDFAIREEAKLDSKHTKVPMFLPNPEENWGPGKRAKGSKKRDREESNEEEEEEEDEQHDKSTPALKQTKSNEM